MKSASFCFSAINIKTEVGQQVEIYNTREKGWTKRKGQPFCRPTHWRNKHLNEYLSVNLIMDQEDIDNLYSAVEKLQAEEDDIKQRNSNSNLPTMLVFNLCNFCLIKCYLEKELQGHFPN